MSARLFCWLRGHEWGAWRGGLGDFFGNLWEVRYCDQCGARQGRRVG